MSGSEQTRRRLAVMLVAFLIVPLFGHGLPTKAAVQVDGLRYVSPTFQWSIAWDGGWSVSDEWSDNGYDSLSLRGPTSFAQFNSYQGFSGDAEACVEAERESLELVADGGVVQVARDGEGRPVRGKDRDGAYAVYLFTDVDANDEPVEVVEYSDCRTLIEGEAVLEISLVAVREAYNDAIRPFQGLLATLAMPGEAPGEEPESEERSLTARQAKRLVADITVHLVDWWRDVFAARELFYVEPFFVVVEEAMDTPCDSGILEPGSGSFYCPLNQTIYFDLSTELDDADGYGRSSVYFTLGHEAGHDIQLQLGVIHQGTATVEMELEADCMAGAYLAQVVDEGDLSDDEFFELLDLVETFGDTRRVPATDDRAHGLGSQRVGMVLRGYHSGVDACGTF
jgi:predicted metalloprotease